MLFCMYVPNMQFKSRIISDEINYFIVTLLDNVLCYENYIIIDVILK